MIAGAHHVACKQRDVVAHALRQLAQDKIRVGHERLLGLGARERAERRAMAERARGVTLVKPAAAAEEAAPAGRLKTTEHPVADVDVADIRAGRDHRPDVLVPDREARLDLHAAVVDVEVRAAHPRCVDPYDRVGRVEDLGLGNILDPHLAGSLECDRSHRAPP